jgi:hypothetical protein
MTDVQPDTGTTTPPEAAPEPLDWQSTFGDLTPEQVKARLDASRKWEDRAKANKEAADELKRVKAETMTETERAVEEARAATRAEVLGQVGGSLVAAEIRAAAAGRQIDTDALISAINPAKFLTEEGQADGDAIKAWIEQVAPEPEPTTPVVPDLGQGVRGQPSAAQTDALTLTLMQKLGPPPGATS